MDRKILERGIIYRARHGSHAYGLNTPSSDLDIKGFFVAPKSYYLGYLNHVEQMENKDPDTVIFELRKFIKLAIDCNPNVIEVLFVDESDILHMDDLGAKIRGARQSFISQKAKHTFSGYAISQLKRIKGHYRWLKNPPKAPPSRTELGLPERTVIPADQISAAESMIKRKIETWNVEWELLDPASRIQIENEISSYLSEVTVAAKYGDVSQTLSRAAGRLLGYTDNFLELLDLERGYKARQEEWRQYQDWLTNRNPARAALEQKYGYDTKHAMHLVRLMRMGEEILRTGQVIVKRSDREELLAIRNNGIWPYEQLIEWAEEKERLLNHLYATGQSPLPKQPDRVALDKLCCEVISTYLSDESYAERRGLE